MQKSQSDHIFKEFDLEFLRQIDLLVLSKKKPKFRSKIGQ